MVYRINRKYYLDVEPKCTIEQAISQSGIIEIFPEIDLNENKVGIWNRVAKLTDVVR